MVRVGSFTVELVNAETDELFLEHHHASQHYAEIEPNAQYWVRVHNHLPKDQMCICEMEVDGKELEPCFCLRGGEVSDNGARNLVDMVDAKRALQVKKTIENSTQDAAIGFWIGSVKVKFYSATKMHERWQNKCENPQSTWQRGEAPKACSNGQKAVVSSIGTIEKTICATPGIYTTYSRGEWLQTIELHYCTAVGLIYVEVLPKPPLWDYHRMLFPPESNLKYANIKPEVKSVQTVVNGNVTQEENHEIFDLTKFENEDDLTKFENEDDDDEDNKDDENTQDVAQAAAAAIVTDESSQGSPEVSPHKPAPSQLLHSANNQQGDKDHVNDKKKEKNELDSDSKKHGRDDDTDESSQGSPKVSPHNPATSQTHSANNHQGDNDHVKKKNKLDMDSKKHGRDDDNGVQQHLTSSQPKRRLIYDDDASSIDQDYHGSNVVASSGISPSNNNNPRDASFMEENGQPGDDDEDSHDV
jgi:hypothetical protein